MFDPSSEFVPEELVTRFLSVMTGAEGAVPEPVRHELWRASLTTLAALSLLYLMIRLISILGARWSGLAAWLRIGVVVSVGLFNALLVVWGVRPLVSARPELAVVLGVALFVLSVWGRVNLLQSLFHALAFAARGVPAKEQPIRLGEQVGVFRKLGLFSSLLELDGGVQRVGNARLARQGLAVLGPPHSTRLELELELDVARGDRLLRDLRMLATLSPFRFADTPVEVEFSSNSLRRVRVSILTWATQEPARARRALRQTLTAYLQQAPESR